MDVDSSRGILYIAALGNNSVEVVDVNKGKVIHRIEGLDEPQGIGFIPGSNEIFVANGGNGICTFYKADNYEKVISLKLSSDADDVRYDDESKEIYVGYGNGGIAVINSVTHQLEGDIKLGAHPEGFQLDKSLNRLYINVPDKHIIAVADLKTRKVIEEWQADGRANFPMAIDTLRHVLFAGYRRPAHVSILDGHTGKVIETVETVEDMDDLYYDSVTDQIFVSGGGGAVESFQRIEGKFVKTVHLPVRPGARTSLLVPSHQLFILAERASMGKDADLIVYKVMSK